MYCSGPYPECVIQLDAWLLRVAVDPTGFLNMTYAGGLQCRSLPLLPTYVLRVQVVICVPSLVAPQTSSWLGPVPPTTLYMFACATWKFQTRWHLYMQHRAAGVEKSRSDVYARLKEITTQSLIYGTCGTSVYTHVFVRFP